MADEQVKRQSYYQQNRERIRTYYKEWYKNNKDNIKERCKLNYAVYYVKQKAEILHNKKAYYDIHHEEIRRKQANFYWENKEERSCRVAELRRFHRYGLTPETPSHKRSVQLDFESKETDELTQLVITRRTKPIPHGRIECKRSVTLTFD
jgi:hypothetical protein